MNPFKSWLSLSNRLFIVKYLTTSGLVMYNSRWDQEARLKRDGTQQPHKILQQCPTRTYRTRITWTVATITNCTVTFTLSAKANWRINDDDPTERLTSPISNYQNYKSTRIDTSGLTLTEESSVMDLVQEFRWRHGLVNSGSTRMTTTDCSPTTHLKFSFTKFPQILRDFRDGVPVPNSYFFLP